jgi:hypothetical protein
MLTRPIVASLGVWLLTVSSALAQSTVSAAIVGVVKDPTGLTLPGVTVEAESPVLIERVKTAITNDAGQFQIVDLRPGTYTVTFTLPGFQTVRHEGIVLSSSFTATINASLQVGAVEETITVTGQSPVVDTRSSVSERALNQELLEGVPKGRGVFAAAMLMPGATTNRPDVGGSETAQITSLSIHGSAGRDVTYNADGLNITSNLGNTTNGTYYNQGLHEEISYQTKALPAEVGAGGVSVNIVTKEGGNAFRSLTFATYTGKDLQSNNVTDEQRALGLRAPSAMDVAYDFNPAGGGPILRDKIWFYGSYRRWVVDRFVANTFNFDGSQAIDDQLISNYSIKLTSQLSPRHRLSGYFDYTDKIRGHRLETSSVRQFILPEATKYAPLWGPNANVKLTSSLRSDLLLEAGFSYFYAPWGARYQPGIAADALSRNDIVQSTLRGAADYSLEISAPERRSWTFITSWLPSWKGAHNIRTGVQYSHAPFHEERTTFQHGDLVARYRNGAPDSVLVFNTPVSASMSLYELGVFIQDAWTIKDRLTLNFGGRFEHLRGQVDEQRAAAGTFVPERRFAKIDDVPNWKTFVPRFAVVYDLFGDGRTALKANASKYTQQQGQSLPNQVNPMRFNSEVRSWSDSNGDGVPQLTEIGAGRGALDTGATVRISPDFRRPYQWEYSLSLEHQLAKDLGITLSYYRRQYYDLYGTVNVAISRSDYSPVTIANPLNAEPLTVYNQNPSTVGRVDNVLGNWDDLKQWYNGFEASINRRFSGAMTLFGGITIGANKECTSASSNPNDQINSCGYASLDSTYISKVAGIFRLPRNLIVSAHFQYFTGQPLERTTTVTRAQVPTLTQVNQTVVLAAAGEYRKPDQTLVDLRFSKIFRSGRLSVEPMVDVFNLFNENASLGEVQVVGPALGQISSTIDGRLVRFGVRVSF